MFELKVFEKTLFQYLTKWINVYYSFTFLQLSVKPILLQIEICILFLVEYLVIFVFFNPMFCTEIYNSLPKEKTFFHAHTRGNYNFFCQTVLWLLIFVWTYCQWSMQWCLPSAATPPLLDMSPVSGPSAQSVMLIQLWSF